MDYLLDTNIIVIYSRGGHVSKLIEQKYQLFSTNNRLFLSAVSLGEINAIIKKFHLGEKRRNNIKRLLKSINKIAINFDDVIEKYGDIDAFSQGKLSKTKSKFTARNMGKNDLWIAATSSVYDLVLITTDKDFTHLHDEYLHLEYVDIESLKNS